MKKIFKRVVMSLGVLATAGILASCGGKEEAGKDALPKEVNIGIIRVPNDKQVAISEDYFKEYFEDKGIKTNFMFFDSGVAANQAFASGSIDFAEMGYTNAVVALSTDIPVKLIWLHEILGSNEALVVPKDSKAKEVKDLKGKKIATPFSSTSHYSLLNALTEAGIKADVKLLDMQTSEIVAAWERGDIDGAYTWEPTLSAIKETGKVLTDSKELADKGYLTANIDLVREDFAKKYPDLVSDYIKVLNKAVSYYEKSPEKAAEAAAKPLEITPEEALKQMKATTWLSSEKQISADFLGTSDKPGNFHQVFMDTANFLKEQGSISEVPTMEEINDFIESSFVEKSLEK
ncbi:MetQ/NlpA family ABC transporter substrate-binding protein [Vagococcus sp. PNs007]|uniref:MetQ/NlpA family ABC transporter substrate-binding protein n=1 Tax=Vagococcus proximus TaxID=2991417 RepID=A0ABT5WYB5_9ENTE|nr:ABC transporter substrate-binding protein [Vagococcus proximus]MDF0478741.1 MetQ/NlpA family ABC transporter substrate-binding protein [Vagococcus proximus]